MTDDSWELPDGADEVSPQAVADPTPLPEPSSVPEPAPSPVPVAFPQAPVRAVGGSDLGAADVVRVIGAALLVVGGLCLAGFLLPHTGRQPMYDEWQVDALFGPQSAMLLAAAAMLFLRKTRDLAAGLVLGGIPLWIADDINAFRPSALFAANIRASGYFFTGAAVCFVPAAILVLLSVTLGRADAPAAGRRPSRAARRSRLIVLLTGIAAVAVYVTGRFMNWAETTIALPAVGGATQTPVHESCCTISNVNGWTRADYLAAMVVLLFLAVVAPVMRSRVTGAGLLFGAGFILSTGIAVAIVTIVAPLRSDAALAQVVATAHLTVTVSPMAGFWIALGGTALLIVAAVLRLTVATGRPKYPEAFATVPAPAPNPAAADS